MFVLKNLFDTYIVRFGLVGVANTAFGLTMIYCAKFVGVGDIGANVFGYCCGILLSFQLNSRWTFRFQGRLTSAFFIFCIVLLVSYLLNLGVVLVAIHMMQLNSYLAQAIGIIPYTLASYAGCRYLVFRPQKNLAVLIEQESPDSGSIGKR